LCRRVWLLAALLATTGGPASAQEPTGYRLLRFQYGVQAPAGDLAERFGTSNSLGGGIERVSIESGWLAGIQGAYFFGNNVKEDVLAGLRAFDGTVIGLDGFPADVTTKERGYYLGVFSGKIFHFKQAAHPLTGIRTEAGVSFLQHKVRIEDNYNSVPALDNVHLPGYDRLTNGVGFTVAAGYQYHHPVNNVHFQLMAEVTGAPTRSRRDFDYASGERLAGKRFDLLAGIRLAWVVTISRKRSAETIIY